MALLSPTLLHGQDLDHANKDVDKIELQPDSLVDGIPPHQAALAHPGVLKHLLNVVKGEASEDGKTTVQPDVLGPHEGATSSGRQNHGGEAGDGYESYTGEEGTAEVEVLLLLGRGANKGDAAHHTDCVQTCAGEDGWRVEHEGGEESGLGEVEGGPEGIFGNVTVAC